MRSRLRGVRSAWTLAALALGVLPAAAADVVIMPFSCSVVDGKPVLAPSDDQAHRIYGSREQRKVKTCSTVDQRRCRQWTTFKFEMDCGGERVSWMQIYANASRHTRRRVSELNGRLRVADMPRRNKRIDDMCARRMGSNMEWWSVNELCEDSSPLNVPTSTDMPAGFAPMVGLDASILPEEALRSSSLRLALDKSADPAVIESKKPAEPTKRDATLAAAKPVPAPDETSTTKPRLDEIEQKPQPRSAEPAPSASEPVVQADASPPPPAAVEPTSPPVTVLNAATDEAAQPAQARNEMAEAPASTMSQAAAAAAKSDRLPPAPTTAAASEARTVHTAEARPPPASATNETVVAKADEHVMPAARDTKTEAVPQTTGSLGETSRADNPADSNLAPASGPESDATLSFAIAAFATAALVMTGLVLNWLYRVPAQASAQSSDTSPSSAAQMFDAATGHARAAMAVPPAGGSLVPVATPTNHPALASTASRTGDRIALSNRVPVNKPEALAILGMGVSAEGNLASMKKIIDGLRMNWHPDLARDDADRHLRELRLKQINAAWEILGDKRAEA